MYKCALTGEPCHVSFGMDDYVTPENCPIGKYENSNIRYKPGHGPMYYGELSPEGTEIKGYISATCRYHGISYYKKYAKEVLEHGIIDEQERRRLERAV